jgi:hypothetical protein
MSAVIFLGPTLPVEQARTILDATYLPPVAQGDVYRALIYKPTVIGIIDGYFEHVPSVWHKEILWAMSQGIHVLGSSSMGALRAAELSVFGMEGVGKVFEAFLNDELQDDDEVAVTHADAENGYIATSTAMVDIRATLSLALGASVISISIYDRLLEIAKRLYYAERVYPTLLDHALQQGLLDSDISAFRAWLTTERFSQKQADAIQLLQVIEARLEAIEPKQVKYFFHYTDNWHSVAQSATKVAP